MSYQLIADLQKKACPKVAVVKACRILEVSRSGYYAHQIATRQRLSTPVVCAASVHLKAAFAASHKADNGHGRVWHSYWQIQGTNLDAAQWPSAGLAA